MEVTDGSPRPYKKRRFFVGSPTLKEEEDEKTQHGKVLEYGEVSSDLLERRTPKIFAEEDDTKSKTKDESSFAIKSASINRPEELGIYGHVGSSSPTTHLKEKTTSQINEEINFDKHLADEPSLQKIEEPGQSDSAVVSRSHTSPSRKQQFDINLFESIVDEPVAPSTLRKLREAAADDTQRAINMFFDGSWRNMEPSISPQKKLPLVGVRQGLLQQPMSSQTVSPEARPENSISHTPVFRYVGAFGVGGWATRSGLGLIKHDDKVKLERQKIQSKVGSLKRGLRTDIIVRFTNSQGGEIGRLPQETATWVSSLIDQQVCVFEGVCVYAPDRVRTNDTIYLQLRCHLLRTAFSTARFTPADNNRVTGLFQEKESEEEKILRLRQYAIVKLFEEINLLPSRRNETKEKEKRQQLLKATEASQQNDDVKPDQSAADDSGPSSSSEQEEGKELEQDQLDTLYKKAQSFDFNTPAAEPPSTFTLDLRNYQKQALHWMMGKEKDEKSEKEESMHPLWDEYHWPVTDANDQKLPTVEGQECFYTNAYSGEMSLDFPKQEQHCLGGILADEMGLGKTIEMLALMHSHKHERAPSPDLQTKLPLSSKEILPAPYTTLVVAPMSLLAQWQSEGEKASEPGSLKTLMYYGSDKSVDLRRLCAKTDDEDAVPKLIITSYGIVQSEFNQLVKNESDGPGRGLFSLSFFRIILDEGHYIKNRQSKTAKACYKLEAEHRWVLTGTPIVNRLEDLFSLVRFLRVEPWSNFSFWKTFITTPFESQEFIRALDVVQTVLEPLVLRRTKDMKTPTGEALVPLPPRIIQVEEIELSPPEREVYDHIYNWATRSFRANVEAGTLMKSYTTIFAQILRLRQSCCHPVLTRKLAIVEEETEAAATVDAANGLADDMDLETLIARFTADSEGAEQDASALFGAHALSQILAETAGECPVCLDDLEPDATAVFRCWHAVCIPCSKKLFSNPTFEKRGAVCPNCRSTITPRDTFKVIRRDDPTDGASTPSVSLRRINASASAKISALSAHLLRLRRENPKAKSVVFSQFTSFLDLIEPALKMDGIRFLRFDGTMAQKQRAEVLRRFADECGETVLLLSLRAGGVGLNLTQANSVFMMDPWWSFAVEAQAIDRVHRMGQMNKVEVWRFVVKDSVEQRMLKIQDRKKFIASSLGMMSDEEKKVQRIEDIRELLS
ncbi:MAG: DNA helicase rad5 [Vezdaea aestivalis]|nr:MAG: DNA helicase rad5 [Vezdaea aestivalis]